MFNIIGLSDVIVVIVLLVTSGDQWSVAGHWRHWSVTMFVLCPLLPSHSHHSPTLSRAVVSCNTVNKLSDKQEKKLKYKLCENISDFIFLVMLVGRGSVHCIVI